MPGQRVLRCPGMPARIYVMRRVTRARAGLWAQNRLLAQANLRHPNAAAA